MVKVMVDRVVVAEGPFPTIAIAHGTTDDGTVEVLAAGDLRPMLGLGEAVAASTEPVAAEFEDWQILAFREIGKNSGE